jgi:DNA-directed RNA polymerase specialized sigma24 family protein
MEGMQMTAQEDPMYALFRRAIVDRDAEAWASVHEQFRRMLSAWAGRSFVCRDHGLDSVAIADQAFARAWAALTPERFANFPTLACILNYLRTCVTTTIIDNVRQQTACTYDLPETHADTAGAPEQIVLAKIERAALWSIVDSVVATQSERIVLIESYTYDLPPRAIHVRHPQLFATVADVYAVKRNLIDRLQRNRELRSLYAEHI